VLSATLHDHLPTFQTYIKILPAHPNTLIVAHRRDQDVHTLHHQLGSRHWARKGERPGIGVEHWHHGHDRVAGVDTEGVRACNCHGMEHIGPVGIDHTFGIACRSAGIAMALDRAFD
jgi:hypothetical protein